MPIKIKCPDFRESGNCSNVFETSSVIGQIVTCPQCKGSFRIKPEHVIVSGDQKEPAHAEDAKSACAL
jgi:hypothetical protein